MTERNTVESIKRLTLKATLNKSRFLKATLIYFFETESDLGSLSESIATLIFRRRFFEAPNLFGAWRFSKNTFD